MLSFIFLLIALPLIGPRAASFASDVRSLLEYPSVNLPKHHLSVIIIIIIIIITITKNKAF